MQLPINVEFHYWWTRLHHSKKISEISSTLKHQSFISFSLNLEVQWGIVGCSDLSVHCPYFLTYAAGVVSHWEFYWLLCQKQKWSSISSWSFCLQVTHDVYIYLIKWSQMDHIWVNWYEEIQAYHGSKGRENQKFVSNLNAY